MKINHKEIPNWIIALTGIVLALMAVLSFFRDKPDSFIQPKETVKNQNVGDVEKNEGQIIINTGPGQVILGNESKPKSTNLNKEKAPAPFEKLPKSNLNDSNLDNLNERFWKDTLRAGELPLADKQN